MKPREIAFLLANVTQVTNLTKNLNINRDAMSTHTESLKLARVRLDKYQAQYRDEEYMKTLSPAESKCLVDNAQALYGVHQELTKELDFLDMSKQSPFVTNAINQLEHTFLLLEWLLETEGKTGETILPRLRVIKTDTFLKGKYKNQIDSLYTELEALAYDLYTDHVFEERVDMLVPICDHLTTASLWVKKEKERLINEALPETKKIELPVEKVPEVPEGPSKELKN